VECAATNWPGVKRAALVQEKDKTILVVEGDVDEAGLKEALKWAHLDTIQKMKAIPVDKRHNAKVDYMALKRLLSK
jgi:hypothetical protein